MRRPAVSIVVASFVLLAACGDSDTDSDATTTAAPPTSTAVTTTEPPPPSSSEAPGTTIDLEAQLAAAEQAYLDAFDAYIAAARDPSNPALRAEIERLYTGPNLEFTMSQLDSFVEQELGGPPSGRAIQDDHPRVAAIRARPRRPRRTGRM